MGLVKFIQKLKIRIFLVLTRLYRNFVAASAETTALEQERCRSGNGADC